MVWFSCDYCNDTIKKPKLLTHFNHCASHAFTCVDCCQGFDRKGAQAHSVCLTETQKYQLCATKPGGTHANGAVQQQQQQQQQQPAAAKAPSEPTGLEFLSVRPPWKCSVCNVSCTSQATLQSHAAGIKHKRRARAALAAQNGTADAAASKPGPGSPAAPASQPPQQQAQPAQQEQQPPQQEQQPQQGAGPAQAANAAGGTHGRSREKDTANGGGAAQQPEGRSSKKRLPPAGSGEPGSVGGARDGELTSEKQQKQKKKKMKKGEEGDEGQQAAVHPALQDDDVLRRLSKAVQKKVAAKGSLGPKMLGKLVAAKLGARADVQLLAAVRAEVIRRVPGLEEQEGFLMPAS